MFSCYFLEEVDFGTVSGGAGNDHEQPPFPRSLLGAPDSWGGWGSSRLSMRLRAHGHRDERGAMPFCQSVRGVACVSKGAGWLRAVHTTFVSSIGCVFKGTKEGTDGEEKAKVVFGIVRSTATSVGAYFAHPPTPVLKGNFGGLISAAR